MDNSHVFELAVALQAQLKLNSWFSNKLQLDKTVSPADNGAGDDLYSCGSEASITSSVVLADVISAFLQMV